MNMENNSKNKKDLFKIINFIGDEISNNSDFAEEYLKDSGYNLEELNAKGIDFINKLKGKLRLKIAQERRVKLFEELKERVKRINSEVQMKSRQVLIEMLKTAQENQISFQFRDLEKLSDEDLLEMVKEEQLLDYLDELRKDIK